jgi:hypothetical protein
VTDVRTAEDLPRSRLFWPAVVAGGLIMGVGVRGLLVNAGDTVPRRWLVVFVGSALAHDLLLAPVVVLLGVAVARLVPVWVRPAVQAGLICSGVVVLFAYPLVRGFGRRADNPTILPLDYGRGLVVVLAAIWLVCGGLALLARRHRRLRTADHDVTSD